MEMNNTPPQSLRSESGWKEMFAKAVGNYELLPHGTIQDYEDVKDFISTQIIEKLILDIPDKIHAGGNEYRFAELKALKQQLRERWLS